MISKVVQISTLAWILFSINNSSHSNTNTTRIEKKITPSQKKNIHTHIHRYIKEENY